MATYTSRLFLVLFVLCINNVQYGTCTSGITHEIETTTNADTWFNTSRRCSLWGSDRSGDIPADDIVVLDSLRIPEELWIGAQFVQKGNLEFNGCAYGVKKTNVTGFKMTSNPITDCNYFCNSSDFVLTFDKCYCQNDVTVHKPICKPFLCKGPELLFCGQTTRLKSLICMCRYQHLKNTEPKIMASKKIHACIRHTERFFSLHDTVTCEIDLRNFLSNPPFDISRSSLHVNGSILSMWEIYNYGVSNIHDHFFWSGTITNMMYVWGNPNRTHSSSPIPCVAVTTHPLSTGKSILLPVPLPCDTRHKGICTLSTRTDSTTRPVVITQVTSASLDRQTQTPSTKHNEETTRDRTAYTPHSARQSPVSKRGYGDTTVTTVISSITSSSSNDNNIASVDDTASDAMLTPIIGGVLAFVVLVIASIVVAVCVRKRRNIPTSKTELNTVPRTNRQEKANNTCLANNGDTCSAVNEDLYDGFHKKGQDVSDGKTDIYDDTSAQQNRMYGRLHHNVCPNESNREPDMHDYSRRLNHITGDTYDTFQTGNGNEDTSTEYYDDSRTVDHITGDTYDTFQTGKGNKDVSEDYYDHTNASGSYGYLQNGVRRNEPADDSYDTLKAGKGNK